MADIHISIPESPNLFITKQGETQYIHVIDNLFSDSAEDALSANQGRILKNVVNEKVDKEAGKGLSTEDYTTAEKSKLAGIEEGANNYAHPSTHPASIISQDSTHRFATDTEKAEWNSKLGTENILAGDNVTVTASGGNVTISAAGGGSGSGVTVVDNLTSTSITSALSANQGRVLKEAVDEKAAAAHTHTKSQITDFTHTHTKTEITDFPASMTPTAHASTATTYGVGTASQYGHVKLANNLTTTATGSALDARQGKALQDSKLDASNILAGDNVTVAANGNNVTISATGGSVYSGRSEYISNHAVGTYTNTIPIPTGMQYAIVFISQRTLNHSNCVRGLIVYIDKDKEDVIVCGSASVASTTSMGVWSYSNTGFITGKPTISGASGTPSLGSNVLGPNNSYITEMALTDSAITMTVSVSSAETGDTYGYGYYVDWMVWK